VLHASWQRESWMFSVCFCHSDIDIHVSVSTGFSASLGEEVPFRRQCADLLSVNMSHHSLHENCLEICQN